MCGILWPECVEEKKTWLCIRIEAAKFAVYVETSEDFLDMHWNVFMIG